MSPRNSKTPDYLSRVLTTGHLLTGKHLHPVFMEHQNRAGEVMADAGFVIAAALRKFTEDLRLLERQLQTAPLTDLAALHEFRQALDEMRMTAWTVTELHIAQSDKKEALASFLAAERIRRFAQIIRDLCRDLEDQQLTWGSGGIHTLFDSVTVLHSRLEMLVEQHRARFRDLKDEQG